MKTERTAFSVLEWENIWDFSTEGSFFQMMKKGDRKERF